jgi:hypothetical protein
MICQVITAIGYLSKVGQPGRHDLIESISLVWFGMLLALMAELLMALMLLAGLIVGFSLSHFVSLADKALLLRAPHLGDRLAWPKFSWWINRSSRPNPKVS